MDMIYANSSLTDIGVLSKYAYDYEAGVKKDECTFEIQVPIKDNLLAAGHYIYVEGTEYGGRIDSSKVDTAKKIIYFNGRTWRGMLGSKIIEPASGQAYYTVSGDANAILGQIITKLGLSALFSASAEISEITISSYTFDRYIDGYTGIMKMLSKRNAKLMINYTAGSVVLSAKAIDDYTGSSELTSDLFDFVVETTPLSVNHMIGLGKGELTDRQVVHRYIGQDGLVTSTQYYTGTNEITEVYDNDGCESLEELQKKTEEELEKCAVESGLKITSHDLQADIGDKFTAHEVTTGISATQFVTNKIVKIENGKVQISYKVGDIL